MWHGRQFIIATATAALAFGWMASPAAANDSAPIASATGYAPSPEMRARWIAECSDRLSAGSRHERRKERAREHDRAQSRCQGYYDDYYAYYRSYQASMAHQMAYPSRRAQSAGCDPSPDCQSGCAETVEYEYVDAPVRATPRPSNRVRIVPDKRVRIVPDKRIRLK